jgi:NodT family efflux transporter outer membrane factor (OMF) lipoprotein
MKLRLMIMAVSCVALSGCAVGPNFRQPEAPKTDRYTAAPLPKETVSAEIDGGQAQRFLLGEKIPRQWWSLFHSEALDKLIRTALSDSPTLAAAQAALRQARENLNAQLGTIISPGADADISARREKFSGTSLGLSGGGNIFNLYNASVEVSYLFDIFGANRRQLEALRAEVNYQRFQLEGAYLTLAANIVTAAGKEASLRAQISATRDIIAALEKQLGVIEEQLKLGGASLFDVLQQKNLIAETGATLPPLENQLAQTRHQLAVLTGKLPAEAGGLPEFNLEELKLPQELPVSIPSALVRQRPDIRASEELLHAASARIGVATANLFPQITLSGNYGSETYKSPNLFNTNTIIWDFGAGLTQPIFHGGELTAKRRAAVAAYKQAAAEYRQTVLVAFQNVADVLRALDNDARQLKAEADALASALNTLNLTKKQFDLGSVSYLSLLYAERQYHQARINFVRAVAARFADTAALFQALGGGWQND